MEQGKLIKSKIRNEETLSDLRDIYYKFRIFRKNANQKCIDHDFDPAMKGLEKRKFEKILLLMMLCLTISDQTSSEC